MGQDHERARGVEQARFPLTALRFIAVLLVTVAILMTLRFAVPHYIDGIATYASIGLVGIALVTAVIGLATS